MSGTAIALARIGALVAGSTVSAAVLVSALESVVLPRDGFTRISRVTFATINRLLVHQRSSARAENLRSLFAPVALISLPLVWMLSVIVGFGFIFWGTGVGTWQHAFEISGSSVTTLGFAAPTGALRTWIAFVEAVIGLGLVALLISYLPTIYAAHHDRQRGISTLRPFAGTPASPVAMLVNLHRFQNLHHGEVWQSAANWLLEVDQTHSAFPALSYFPEADRRQSWVASVGTLLDAASLMVAISPTDPAMGEMGDAAGPLMSLAHGMPAITHIALAVGLPIGRSITLVEVLADPEPDFHACSVTRAEFEQAWNSMTAVLTEPVRPADEAWPRFVRLRSTYDQALRGLAGLTNATPAPWTTDRPATVGRPRIFTGRPIKVDWSSRVSQPA